MKKNCIQEETIDSRLQNYSKAKYLSIVSQLSRDLNAPSKYFQISSARAELVACDLALQFLARHKLNLTLSSCESESRGDMQRRFEDRWLARRLQIRGRQDVLNGLIQKRKNHQFHVGFGPNFQKKLKEEDNENSSSVLEGNYPRKMREEFRRINTQNKNNNSRFFVNDSEEVRERSVSLSKRLAATQNQGSPRRNLAVVLKEMRNAIIDDPKIDSSASRNEMSSSKSKGSKKSTQSDQKSDSKRSSQSEKSESKKSNRSEDSKKSKNSSEAASKSNKSEKSEKSSKSEKSEKSSKSEKSEKSSKSGKSEESKQSQKSVGSTSKSNKLDKSEGSKQSSKSEKDEDKKSSSKKEGESKTSSDASTSIKSTKSQPVHHSNQPSVNVQERDAKSLKVDNSSPIYSSTQSTASNQSSTQSPSYGSHYSYSKSSKSSHSKSFNASSQNDNKSSSNSKSTDNNVLKMDTISKSSSKKSNAGNTKSSSNKKILKMDSYTQSSSNHEKNSNDMSPSSKKIMKQFLSSTNSNSGSTTYTKSSYYHEDESKQNNEDEHGVIIDRAVPLNAEKNSLPTPLGTDSPGNNNSVKTHTYEYSYNNGTNDEQKSYFYEYSYEYTSQIPDSQASAASDKQAPSPINKIPPKRGPDENTPHFEAIAQSQPPQPNQPIQAKQFLRPPPTQINQNRQMPRKVLPKQPVRGVQKKLSPKSKKPKAKLSVSNPLHAGNPSDKVEIEVEYYNQVKPKIDFYTYHTVDVYPDPALQRLFKLSNTLKERSLNTTPSRALGEMKISLQQIRSEINEKPQPVHVERTPVSPAPDYSKWIKTQPKSKEALELSSEALIYEGLSDIEATRPKAKFVKRDFTDVNIPGEPSDFPIDGTSAQESERSIEEGSKSAQITKEIPSDAMKPLYSPKKLQLPETPQPFLSPKKSPKKKKQKTKSTISFINEDSDSSFSSNLASAVRPYYEVQKKPKNIEVPAFGHDDFDDSMSFSELFERIDVPKPAKQNRIPDDSSNHSESLSYSRSRSSQPQINRDVSISVLVVEAQLPRRIESYAQISMRNFEETAVTDIIPMTSHPQYGSEFFIPCDNLNNDSVIVNILTKGNSLIGEVEIPTRGFRIGKSIDKWFSMQPQGKVHLVLTPQYD